MNASELASWVERNIFYIGLDFDGDPVLSLRSNGYKLAERWQAKCKELGLIPELEFHSRASKGDKK